MGNYDYLYVEDDPLSREVMEMLLTNVVGVNSLTMFHDSTNFIDHLKDLEATPDFIFLDIHIEPHDGYELLAQLRSEADYEDCRVIAVTASVMADEVQKLKDRGFDGVLAKPLDMATFPELVTRLESGEVIWQIL